ncbi:MAG TPA: hypothetical protein VI258_10525 [Rhodanobacteraceae bacterium]
MTTAALLILALAPGVADPIFGSDFDDLEGCPNGRQTVADIDYPGMCAHLSADVTEWSNIWGWSCDTGDTTPFPGLRISPTIMNFRKDRYIAAHVHVPDDFLQGFGWISHAEYDYGQNLTASFSTACGDFAPANPVCRVDSVSGQGLVPWRVGAVPGTFCPLIPGQDYFFNLKMTDPSTPSTTCESSSPWCAIALPNHF